MKKTQPCAGIFMVVFLFCALFSGLFVVWNTRGDVTALRSDNFFNGRWASLYEGTFDKSLHFHETSKNFWGIINYALFKEGRDGVIVGKDGWLFTSEEFAYSKNAESNLENNIEYIYNVHSFFKEKGIELIVTVIPSKARVYPDQLGSYTLPKNIEPIYQDIRAALKRREIVVTDVLWIMEKKRHDFELFLKTDTHWTPIGAKLAAKQVANEYRKNLSHVAIPPTQFESKHGKEIEHEGDLMRYIPLGDLQEKIGPEKDAFKVITTEKQENIDEDAINSNEGDMAMSLFGEETIPVALVGTSYSANKLWNFAGFLREAMGAEVLNAADEGMGPFETMENYLKDEALATNPPQVVVWEIPERYTTVKYDLEKPL